MCNCSSLLHGSSCGRLCPWLSPATAALRSGRRVPLQLLCPGSLRRRSDAGQWNVCRLSRLSPRTYLKDLAAAGATVGIALRSQQAARGARAAWTLERLRACTQVSPELRSASGSLSLSLSLSLSHSMSYCACIACLGTIIYVCAWAARCDLPCACCSLSMFVS